MAENYFPQAKDFDEMGDHLERIASILVDKAEIDTSDWASIQKAVRTGIAPKLFPVGTQLTVRHTKYGDLKVDVVAHDHYESVDIKGAHTMTLMFHEPFESLNFDPIEAFYYAENQDLPEGTYRFYGSQDSSISGQFTLTKPLAKGGQLCYKGNLISLSAGIVFAYESPTSIEESELCALARGSGGTSLGTLGAELNHGDRVIYGSNNYKESYIRQYLNNLVWSPQTKYDRPFNTFNGEFLKGFSDSFLACVGRVKVPCVANESYESPDSTVPLGQTYLVNDKFFLPSRNEIFGDYTQDGSSLLPFFEDASKADRIKYSSGSPMAYWLRTPAYYSAYFNCMVTPGGEQGNQGAESSNGIVPMFNIV